MSLNVSDITKLLEERSISVKDLMLLRRQLAAPFRQHPLGFFACTLITEGSRKIRLHYWPVIGRQQSPDCQIHDHIFEFESWVLLGAVENIEYQSDVTGEEFTLYRTEYAGELSILRKTSERICLSERGRNTHYAGSSYKVSAGVLHESRRVGMEAAFTVLLTEDVAVTSPLVAGSIHGNANYVYQRSVLEDSVIEVMLEEL